MTSQKNGTDGKVRNIRSVRNLNTFIYSVLNVRTLAKAKSINKGLLQMSLLQPS